MDQEKGKFQYSALRFIFDMELVDDPQLINHMKMNIFSISRHIKDTELLSSIHTKSMLVYIDLNWVGRTFLKNRIEAEVFDRVKELLPNFNFRVVSNKVIFDMAIEKVKNALKGGTSEKISAKPSDDTGSNSGSGGK